MGNISSEELEVAYSGCNGEIELQVRVRLMRIPGLFLFSLIKNNVVTPHKNHPRTNNSFKNISELSF